MSSPTENKTLNIPYPPDKVFKYRKNRVAPAQEVMQQQQAMFIFERMDYPETGGQYAYFEGVPYPSKGHPFPEAIYAMNAAKRLTKLGIDFFAQKKVFFSLLGFVISPYKKFIITRLLSSYTEACRMFITPYVIEEHYSTPCTNEIMGFIRGFLLDLGIDSQVATDFAEAFSMQIEYDNAYRLRIEDTMSETTKERLLENPRKEIKRLITIISEREPAWYNTDKFKAAAKILGILLYVPKIRRAFNNNLKASNFANFQLDEADRYHVLLWADYNFLGKPIEERIEMYKERHKDGMPRRILYTPAPI